MPSPDVDVCGILCDDLPDADGIRWIVENTPGWESPAVSVGAMSPSGAHGLSLTGSWYRERSVTVNGAAQAPTYEAAWEAYQRISSVAPLAATADLIVYEPTPKFLRVALGDVPRVREPSPSHVVQWSLVLTAEYPFKRALTPTTTLVAAGTSPTLTTGGNMAAEVEVELATAGTVSLTIGGLTLSTGTLPAGSVLRSIDRTIVDDTGADAFSAWLSGSQWPALAPGNVVVSNGGTADLYVTRYDTFA